MPSCVKMNPHEWCYLLLSRVYAILWNRNELAEKLYLIKIMLCYLLLLEVYTHLFFGLHALDAVRFQSMRRAYLVTTTSLWLPLQTRMLTTHFLFIWNLLIWNGKRSVPTFLLKRSKSERREGRLFKSRTGLRALAKVLYWTSLGATGMVLPNGCRMTLVMVVPHLCCWNGFPPLCFPSPFPFFPFREGIPLKESLPFIPSSPFLPFPFPQKAVSCWSFSHAISDGSRVLNVCLSFHITDAYRVSTLTAQNPEIGFCQTCKSFLSCVLIYDPRSLLSFISFSFIYGVEGRPFSVRDIWISDSTPRRNNSRNNWFTCKYVYCCMAIWRMFMEETKRSRCCSFRSDWTKKISDIKLSHSGNACWCCAIRYRLFPKGALIRYSFFIIW